jgi:hypothetical protein
VVREFCHVLSRNRRKRTRIPDRRLAYRRAPSTTLRFFSFPFFARLSEDVGIRSSSIVHCVICCRFDVINGSIPVARRNITCATPPRRNDFAGSPRRCCAGLCAKAPLHSATPCGSCTTHVSLLGSLPVVKWLARRGESLAGRANVNVLLLVEAHVFPTERPIFAHRLVDRGDIWRYLRFIDQPVEVGSGG